MAEPTGRERAAKQLAHAVDASREIVREWAVRGETGEDEARRKLAVVAGLADTDVDTLLYEVQLVILKELNVIEQGEDKWRFIDV